MFRHLTSTQKPQVRHRFPQPVQTKTKTKSKPKGKK
jgi:hypothetical protein